MLAIATAIIFMDISCSQMLSRSKTPDWIVLTEVFSDSEGHIIVVGCGRHFDESIAKGMAEIVAYTEIAEYIKKNFFSTNPGSIKISASPVRRYYDQRGGYYYVLMRTNRTYK